MHHTMFQHAGNSILAMKWLHVYGCKNTVFLMLGPSLMNQNEFSLEVTNAVIARILFSACWNLLWLIKTNLVWRWQMQWLQEYYFMYVGTLCDASKRIFFLSIVCSDCKNTVFYMLEPSLMNQNEFSFQVTNAVFLQSLHIILNKNICFDAS